MVSQECSRMQGEPVFVLGPYLGGGHTPLRAQELPLAVLGEAYGLLGIELGLALLARPWYLFFVTFRATSGSA